MMRRTVEIKPLEPWVIAPGTTMHFGDIKHFWTGLQWVSEEYLREVMNAPREYELYDRHNKRRAAVAATKRNQP
jgi:hypothetical protein